MQFKTVSDLGPKGYMVQVEQIPEGSNLYLVSDIQGDGSEVDVVRLQSALTEKNVAVTVPMNTSLFVEYPTEDGGTVTLRYNPSEKERLTSASQTLVSSWLRLGI
jgi:hypothetical protein